MIVVADSGPLQHLILLDHSELLRRFHSRVVVPDAVASELSAAGAPPTVRDWILQPPSWVSVVPVALEAVFYVDDALVNASFQRWLGS
jgi:predicted nucleic acid-binding protein